MGYLICLLTSPERALPTEMRQRSLLFTSTVFFLVAVLLQPSQQKETTNDLSCALCKTVMELVDQAITDGANEQAVADALAQACDLLPSPWTWSAGPWWRSTLMI